MTIRKILFSDQDWAKDGSLSGGSWESLAPISGIVNNIRPQVVAQATGNDEVSTQFLLDLGTAREIGIVYFSNLITDSSCTMHVDIGDGFSGVYNSGVVSAWARNASGVLSEEEVISLGRTRIFIPPSPVTARYVEVFFSQTSSLTPLRLGSLNVCSVYEPTFPAEIGGSFQVIDDSDINRVAYGSLHITERGKRLRMNVGLSAVEPQEAFNDLLRLARERGKSKPLNVVLFPDDLTPSVGLERFSIYGTMNNDNVINNPHFGLYSQAFSIDQLI